MQPLPKDLAVRMCAEIRNENLDQLFSATRWQCWGCLTFSGGYHSRMNGQVVNGNLVRDRYDLDEEVHDSIVHQN